MADLVPDRPDRVARRGAARLAQDGARLGDHQLRPASAVRIPAAAPAGAQEEGQREGAQEFRRF
eukprot:3058043-Prymnesium_polylepis.1